MNLSNDQQNNPKPNGKYYFSGRPNLLTLVDGNGAPIPVKDLLSMVQTETSRLNMALNVFDRRTDDLIKSKSDELDSKLTKVNEHVKKIMDNLSERVQKIYFELSRLAPTIENTTRKLAEFHTARLSGCLLDQFLAEKEFSISFANLPRIEVSEEGLGLPSVSAVYIVWNSDKTVYVGQSVNVSIRATTRHEKIFPGDEISWIPCPIAELNFVECLCIGLLRPERNFHWDRRSNMPQVTIPRKNEA